MTEPIPTFAQEAYAVLYNRFAGDTFQPSYLSWFVSRGMIKKTLHALERAGWIRRVGRGAYVCLPPGQIFASMVQFRVPELLKGAGMKYVFADASAVEIWADYTYIQRSWEHSPYYVRVLEGDLKRWVGHFRRHRVRVFVSEAEPCLGEFVVLQPRQKLPHEEHNDLPVEPLDSVVKYCESNIDVFEYPLAYLKAKFGARTKTKLDRRVLSEAARAV